MDELVVVSMPKRATSASRPEILLDTHLSVPLYKQLYERIRSAILSGHLEGGARLPSTRHLASELGISRTTAVLAYEHLVSEGYLECRVGQGTIVACHLPAPFLPEPADTTQEKSADAVTPPSLHLASRVRPLQQVLSPLHFEGSPRGAYHGNEPALDRFPYKMWARLIARRARQSLPEVAPYQSPFGYLPLREAIAAHIGITRGVHCTPEQVIITAGAQGALDLAVRTLLNPGETVWLENPGYFGARGALLSVGNGMVPKTKSGTLYTSITVLYFSHEEWQRGNTSTQLATCDQRPHGCPSHPQRKESLLWIPLHRTLTDLKFMAFCHGIIHCAGANSTSDLTVRLPIGLKKIDDQWIVFHEHHSEAQPG